VNDIKGELRRKWSGFFDAAERCQEIKRVADAYPVVRSLVVEYADLDHYDPDFAARLFTHPRTMLAAGERVIKELVPAGSPDGVDIVLQIRGLPKDRRVEIRDIRVGHLGKFVSVRGLIKRATEVQPRYTTAMFECLRCGRHIPVEQVDDVQAEPLECIKDGMMDQFGNSGCGRVSGSTSFRLVPEFSTFIDSQKIEIQEMPGEAADAQSAALVCMVEGDQAGVARAGGRVILNGAVRCRTKGKRSERSNTTSIFLDVNTVESLDEGMADIEITSEMEATLRGISQSPTLDADLVGSICPTIRGYPVEKLAIALHLFGGVDKHMPDGTDLRGDIHLLLVGDPGTAKSQILKYVSRLWPRGIYASGKSTSSAGLTAAVVKDEFGGDRWVVEAGVLVQANGGGACIDELDKMTEQDRSSLHEAMEQGTITVTKAAKVTLSAKTSILAAANPKMGRFQTQPGTPIAEEINLPPTLLSRFDLIFPIFDRPNEQKDTEIAEHMLKAHRLGEGIASDEGGEVPADVVPVIPQAMLRKYIAFARGIKPRMDEDAMRAIEEYYVSVRRGAGRDSKAVPITARQLEALVRLSEASARSRLSKEVTKQDAERAIGIFKDFMNRVIGIEGIDVVMTGLPRSQIQQMEKLAEIVKDLVAEDKAGAQLEKIQGIATTFGIPANRVETLLKKAGRELGLYTPREGVWKVM